MLRYVLLMTISVYTVLGSNSFANPIDEIKSLYSTINQIPASEELVKVFFTSDGGWKESKDIKAAGENGVITAKVYIHNRGVVKITYEGNSDVDADWGIYREYYFYKNHSLAFVFDKIWSGTAALPEDKPELSKVEGPYTIEIRRYYDKNGSKIRELTKAFDDKTKTDLTKYIDFIKHYSMSIFPTVESFGFPELIKK